MSIIYDALKKSQQARAGKSRVTAAVKQRITKKNMLIVLLLLTSIFVITATISITGKLIKLSENKVVVAPKPKAPAPVIASAPRLMLEGVFLSDTERLALINHHAYHEGDSINGMKVVNIAFEGVTLKSNTHSVQLRSVMTQLD